MKISFKYIKIVLLIIIPVAIVFYLDLISEHHRILSLFLNEYQIDRILPLVNPDLSSSNYYQTKNSIWAIGSGQLRGKGLYNGTINQLSYLPYSHNDFIFSVVLFIIRTQNSSVFFRICIFYADSFLVFNDSHYKANKSSHD